MKCPTCNSEFSRKNGFCIHCGAFYTADGPRLRAPRRILAILLLALAALCLRPELLHDLNVHVPRSVLFWLSSLGQGGNVYAQQIQGIQGNCAGISNCWVVTPSGITLAQANTLCTTNGGGLIFLTGGLIQSTSAYFGDTSHHVCTVVGMPGTELELTSVDASGMGFCGFDGSWITGFVAGGTTSTNSNGRFVISMAASLSPQPVWLITNCRHSGQDQTFGVQNLSVTSRSRSNVGATGALIECSGCFSGTEIKNVNITTGFTNSWGWMISSPAPSGVNIPYASGSVASGVCTINTPAVGTNGSYPVTHAVWMAPLNGAGSSPSAATVVVSGATGPNSGTGINITATVSGVLSNTSFTYPCPSATNGAMTGSVVYNVKNDAGGNNLAIDSVNDIDNVIVGMGTGAGNHPCGMMGLGTGGNWGGIQNINVNQQSECDGGIASQINLEIGCTNLVSNTPDCTNYPGTPDTIHVQDFHCESSGVNSSTICIKCTSCKNLVINGVTAASGGATDTMVSLNGSTTASSANVFGLSTNNWGHLIFDNIDSTCGSVGSNCDGQLVNGQRYLVSNFFIGPGSQGIAPACFAGGAAGTTSPAACVNAATGKVAVPASQTSYTINSASVTANSIILIQNTTDNSGLPSSPTCSVTLDNPLVTSRVAGTSFTFSLTSVAAVECYNWYLTN